MFTTAMLQVVTNAGEAVLLLIDGLEAADFTRSRLTRQEVRRQLQLLAGTLDSLPPPVQARLPEIDWAGWRLARQVLAGPPGTGDDTAWFAARALVPATLSWLRVYQQAEPTLFSTLVPR